MTIFKFTWFEISKQSEPLISSTYINQKIYAHLIHVDIVISISRNCLNWVSSRYWNHSITLRILSFRLWSFEPCTLFMYIFNSLWLFHYHSFFLLYGNSKWKKCYSHISSSSSCWQRPWLHRNIPVQSPGRSLSGNTTGRIQTLNRLIKLVHILHMLLIIC